MAETITLNSDGDMDVFVALPDGAGPHPAMVVAHHRAGLDAFTTKFVQDLASLGYAAAAPDLHHRRPDGEDTRVSLQNLDDVQIVADLQATVDHLAGLDEVDGGRLSIGGHCMGGRVAFLGAASIDVFKACVVYYGGNMFKVWGGGDVPPAEKLGNLKGPVLGFFGNDDENPSPEDVSTLDVILTDHGTDHEFHAYDGCGHAFQNFMNPAGYRPKATRTSLDRMVEWLGERL